MASWLRTTFLPRLAAAALAVGLSTAAPASGQTAQSPTAAPAATASPRSLELTRRYFTAMRMDKTMAATLKAVMPSMVERLSKSNPNLTAAQRAAIIEVAAQSGQAMVLKMMDRMAPVFAQSFTEQELQDLVDFYEGPTGQALVAKTPAFAAKMNPAVAQMMPEFLADMESRLCARLACQAKPAPAKPS